MQQKVLVYVVRAGADGPEVLVFTHRDFPDAGLQAPAGTLEPGEASEAAAYREVEEESGLTRAQVRLVRKLAEAEEPEWDQKRHVYLFVPVTPLPDRWTHTVAGAGGDQGLVFAYDWMPVAAAQRLAGGQGRFLHLAGT
jgi:8-oxo-dGTP pyrophosphatase MutT (NUDIX family)